LPEGFVISELIVSGKESRVRRILEVPGYPAMLIFLLESAVERTFV
jgi:hypothetical protein